MSYLLDTHTFLWAINDTPRLPEKVVERLEDAENDLYLSVASLWEIAIKFSLGKLQLDFPFATLTEKVSEADLRLLPIRQAHLDELVTLPFHHRDPFDRLLVAQSLSETLTLMTRDSELAAYGGKVIWNE